MKMNEFYKHYKGGVYQVICTATDSETSKERVIYRAADGKIWDRPASMWNDTIDGVPRFKLMDEMKGRAEFAKQSRERSL